MKRLAFLILASLNISILWISSSNAEISSTRNFYSYSEQLLTSGQPSEERLKNISKDGVEVVINLVPPSEMVYNENEGKILQSQGVEYIHIPVNWRSPKKVKLDKFLSEMERVKGKKVLIHCWSNARASAFAYAFRVSQSPKSQSKEWDRLRKVWTNVAGYDLDDDQVWQKYLRINMK